MTSFDIGDKEQRKVVSPEPDWSIVDESLE